MEVEDKAALVRNVQESPFWKEIFLPEFKGIYSHYEMSAHSTKDPVECYKYTAMCAALERFRLRFDDILDEGKPRPKVAQ